MVFGFMTSQTAAIGLGAYINAGFGGGDWEAEDEDDNESDFDTDDTGSGFGFVLDTAVAKDRVFNYRLNVGFERKDYDFESDDTLEIDNFVVVNDFGFGVVRTPKIRFWLGPELKIASGSGSADDDDDFDVDLVSVGLGPVLGLNVHVSKLVTLGFKTGLLFESIVGKGEHDTRDEETDFTGDDTYFYFSFAVIFRINDEYKKK